MCPRARWAIGKQCFEPRCDAAQSAERLPLGHKPGDLSACPAQAEDNALATMQYEKSALCPNYKHADALAAKRWNVAKWLCAKKCDIGMTACPYWQQFKVVGSCCITHQILFIPNHMESLVSNNEPTIIFDEPNPQTFIEQVNITPKVLTEEIARHKGNPEITEFLELLRYVVEGFEGTYITGSAVIQLIVGGGQPVQDMPNLEGLSKAERQKAIKEFLKRNVGWSNVKIAIEMGSSEATIRRHRQQLESAGEIENLGKRVGLDGKMRKQSTSSKMISTSSKKVKNDEVENENGTPENDENHHLGEKKVNQTEGQKSWHRE